MFELVLKAFIFYIILVLRIFKIRKTSILFCIWLKNNSLLSNTKPTSNQTEYKFALSNFEFYFFRLKWLFTLATSRFGSFIRRSPFPTPSSRGRFRNRPPHQSFNNSSSSSSKLFTKRNGRENNIFNELATCFFIMTNISYFLNCKVES